MVNLQAAIGAYYDFESPNISVPSMSFVEDVTIGEGESIPPDTQFIKTWRIQNSGAEAWPPGVCLKYVGGDQFGHVNMVMVRSLEPQEIADVSVQMCSPSRAGMYQGQCGCALLQDSTMEVSMSLCSPGAKGFKVTSQLPQHCSQSLSNYVAGCGSLFQPHAGK
uniref:Nbr1 FW domain-containing protein n=1 Tax=Bos indicus x Bos taurus TaxID=30522 RepID=A0A4W2H453_BOBOX